MISFVRSTYYRFSVSFVSRSTKSLRCALASIDVLSVWVPSGDVAMVLVRFIIHNNMFKILFK